MVVGRAAVLRPLSWQRAVQGKAGHGLGTRLAWALTGGASPSLCRASCWFTLASR